jgi:hypothetical protein
LHVLQKKGSPKKICISKLPQKAQKSSIFARKLGGTVFRALSNFSKISGLQAIGFVSFLILNFSKKYLLLVEIPVFC